MPIRPDTCSTADNQRPHRWRSFGVAVYICANCGTIKRHLPEWRRTLFERAGQTVYRTPECDGVWPEGWNPTTVPEPKPVMQNGAPCKAERPIQLSFDLPMPATKQAAPSRGKSGR